MLRLTLRKLVYDPLILSLFVITGVFMLDLVFFGKIDTTANAFTFLVHGATIKGSAFVLQYNFILILVTVIGLAKHFIELTESEHISLIISNPISRTELLIKDIAGVFALYTIYCLLSTVLFGMLFWLKSGDIPQNFMISISSVPLIVLTVYTVVVLFSLISNSYSITVLFTFIYCYLISPFVTHHVLFFRAIDLDMPSIAHSLNLAGYVMPNASEALTLLANFYDGDVALYQIVIILFSLIPSIGISIYLIENKEFK